MKKMAQKLEFKDRQPLQPAQQSTAPVERTGLRHKQNKPITIFKNHILMNKSHIA